MTDRPDGIAYPCRAIVRSSAADQDGYRATVEVLDGRGEPTRQRLPDLPLDPLYDGRDGAGFFAPPMPGRIVAVDWEGGSSGHPFIVAPAWARLAPAVPSIPVAAGEGSLQDGDGGELRYRGGGRWHLIDGQGAVVSVDGSRWKVAADDDLLTILLAWLDALIAAMTEIGSTTDAAGHTGPVPKLPFDGPTIAALTVIKTRLARVLRS